MQLISINPEVVFQALSDEARLRIIRLMSSVNDNACLCELVDSLQEPAYKLSRHLKILRQAGILTSKKDGRWIYHGLVKKINYLDLLYKSVQALPDPSFIYQADLERFKQRMSLREDGRCRVGILSDDLKVEAK
jgi:ArsR family transcriptional regulator